MHLLSALRRSDALRSFTGLWLVAFLAFGPTLSAAIRTVDDNAPADYPSITAALAASSSGDTIQVAAGTYDESIENFPLALKDGVAIVGAGRTVTTIRPDAGTPAFVNDNTTLAATTRLEGFTITHVAGEDDPLMMFILGSATMAPVVTDNEFVGNADETDGGVFIGGTAEGGSFTGTISDNRFTAFSGGSSGLQAQLAPAETFDGGGIVMTVATEGKALRHRGGVATNALPGEDNITPTITGNTFDGNSVGVAALGTYSYDYSAAGVVAPTIDQNSFDTNALDVLLAYSGFGAREFKPVITNNVSTDSAIHVAALPFFGGGGPVSSASGSKPAVSLKDRLNVIRDNFVHHRMGANPPRFAQKIAKSGRLHTSGTLIAPTVSDITITGNTITDPEVGGVFMYQYLYGGTSLDMKLNISNNEITGGGLAGIGVATAVTSEAIPIADSVSIQQNRVTGANIGLAMGFSECSCTSLNAPSTNAALIPTDPANDIQIIGNILENGGEGLELGSDGYSSLAALVSCNIIRNNASTGVLINDGSDPTPDFGGGSRTSPGKNSIHDNNADMENEDADLVKAEHNWWGTTNLGTIETNTVDFTEDNTVGDIDFDPPLAAEATDCIVSSGNADLALTKVVTSTGPYVVGSNITYQLTVTNNGPDPATNVVVSDPLPPGTSFVQASPTCSLAANTVTCTAAALANGASTSFDITVQAQLEGSVVNTATVTSDETDSTPGNSTATAPAVPIGALAVTPIPTTSEWGLMLMGLMLAMVGIWFTRRM
jgi:uncharacterized repeat protein (TIGR01451 family)